MKKYEKPEMNVQSFEVEDVITASSSGNPTGNGLDEVNGNYETPGFVF